MFLGCGAVCGGGVREGTIPLAQLWACFQSLPMLPTSKLGPSGSDSRVGSRTLWVSPMNSPVELGVSPTAATPIHFYSQKFRGFISLCWNPGLRGLSCSPVVPPALSARECGTPSPPPAASPTWSSSRHLAMHPLPTDALLHPIYRSK